MFLCYVVNRCRSFLLPFKVWRSTSAYFQLLFFRKCMHRLCRVSTRSNSPTFSLSVEIGCVARSCSVATILTRTSACSSLTRSKPTPSSSTPTPSSFLTSQLLLFRAIPKLLSLVWRMESLVSISPSSLEC